MTPEFFNAQIKRLKSQWPNSFSDERAKLIYAQTKDMPDAWLGKFCDTVLGNFRQAPILADFLADASAFTNDANNVIAFKRKEDGLPPCGICSDGIVWLSRWDGAREVSIMDRCACPRGDKHKIPTLLKSTTTPKTTGRDRATGEKDDAT